MKKITLLLIITTLFISCDGDSKKVYKEANGRINHLLVVMKNSEWQGELGDELRKIIAEPVLGLPQPESQFEVTQVPPESFNSMFRATRSVLKVGISDETSFLVSSNVYAAPQKIITITGKNKEALIAEIKKNSKKIVEIYKNADLISAQNSILKKFWDPTQIETFVKQGYSLKIPRNYSKVEDNGEFVWYRYHLNGDNSMELITYTVPITSEDDENGNNIVAIRNAFGKKNIPGQIEDSYMITEEAYSPHIFEVELDGKKAFETRGKWEVNNVYMAGPFLSYTVVDKPNNRLVVVEGLTFAPSINKRDYMFELEAILKTLKIN
ncbi:MULTISPECIES: DUF4837 family protein [Flavobacteriaceae]|uniref:DUF4837 family protein n=2 Tax=Flavobacteriaceae TaxID=49546 RepID=A0A4Y8ARE4_9FLAO|nr:MULTISPECIES: DUF4837 family protein [Flavobacteriaceae]TEW73770.1 DUF4837 family protein [Gramella jeungdoensis]GGK37413.1 hypothetical protein GCM10007963_01900 [Lutibacter litoralis]